MGKGKINAGEGNRGAGEGNRAAGGIEGREEKRERDRKNSGGRKSGLEEQNGGRNRAVGGKEGFEEK